MTTGRPITIGLLGHTTTSSNLGIGALTVSNMRIMQEVASRLGRDIRFEVTAWKEPHAEYVTGENIVFHPLSRKFILNPGGLRAMANRCDLVLDICGGDSFTDIYGTKRFLTQLAAQTVVVLTGKPLGFAPETIGPFDRPWVKTAAKGIMRRSAFVFARDSLSSDYVRSMSEPRINLKEATDVAFHLPYDPRPAYDDGKTHVGINVSGLLFGGGYTGKNEFGLKMDYPSLIRGLISHFDAMEDCQVHLIGHVIIDDDAVAGEDDQRACVALGKEFPSVIVEPPSPDPQTAKSLISSMDFFFGARMHACIAAVSSGVPVVPMAYSRKFMGLFGTLGYNHVVDCREGTANDVHKSIVAAFDDRAALSEEVADVRKAAALRLDTYRDELESVFRTFKT